ncbi:MAG: replication and repair protein RecR, recombination protein RecR protein [Candidatus Peregrinibacteria bacterium GW2011_GWF2_38_29]|nr:MAG: replication and repair protein RecR, recombination protein RecR protein [Candidatus Peregrinibacteria bacterium GW2011_GWF2_38_29]HBB03251.1 recombination protein RecR [Candidatus Peregrinibacteria bacterium]
MSFLPKQVNNLIEELSKLPGIGPKTAERLTLHLLKTPETQVNNLSDAVRRLKEASNFCPICWALSDIPDCCEICRDNSRDQKTICVVEQIIDIGSIEKTGYKGVYHVLHGAIAPVDGIGPDELKIKELVNRISCNPSGVCEVILATNPSHEGDATSIYISNLLKPSGVNVTRIARGIPVGGNLNYTDELTLMRSIEGRKAI